MQISLAAERTIGSGKSFRVAAAILSAMALVVSTASQTSADVVAVGDTDPESGMISDAGGDIGGDLTVGVTDIGGLFMDIAPPLSGPLMPLESTNGIIGDGINAIGQASFDDFGVEWIVAGNLTVGREGQGFLDVSDGARISVGDNTSTPGVFTMGEIIVGDELASQGIATVDGFASILETFTMTIGDLGYGTLDVSNRGTLRSQIATIGNQPDSYGRVTLTGLGTRWVSTEMSSKEFIVAEEGRGILEILDQAMVLNAESVCIGHSAGAHGTVTVSGAGSLWQIDDDSGTDDLNIGTASGFGELFVSDGGLVRVDDSTTVAANSFLNLASGGVINSASLGIDGIVRGDGRIESDVTVGTGELRNAAGVANLREKLLVTGTVTNNGLIESLGGEMEFQSPVINSSTGDFVSRDAVTRFQTGLVNDGEMGFGGESTIYANITGGGDVLILEDTETLLVGSLTLASSSALSLTVGDNPGSMNILGDLDLGDSLLNLLYSSGVGAQTGDSYEVLYASGGVSGTFSNSQAVAGGLVWDIDYSNPNAVIVTASSLTIPADGADFNGDGVVNGLDLLIWEMNAGITMGADIEDGDADNDGDVDYFDFLWWQRDFGGPPTPSPLVAPVLAVAAPEPSSAVLLLLGTLLVGTRSYGQQRRSIK